MQKLPKGYYAVASLPEGAPLPRQIDQFTYKGITYTVTPGVNLFATLHQAAAAACDTPTELLPGLQYNTFTTPVILFSAGEHNIDKFCFDRSLTLLGQGAGINPNLPASGDALPGKNAAFDTDKSILAGSYWHGHMRVEDPAVAEITCDGLAFLSVRFKDLRTTGNSNLTFKNIEQLGPCGYHLFDFAAGDQKLNRQVGLHNTRVVDYDNLGYGNSFLHLHAQNTLLQGVCFANSALVFGFTNIPKSFATGKGNITLKDCYFANLQGENGIATALADPATAKIDLTVENCTFVDASRANESPLQPHLANQNCSFTLKNCKFFDTRGNQSAVTVRGEGKNILVQDCSLTGFAEELFFAPALPKEAPDYINTTPHTTACADPHKVVAGDFTNLDTLYAGRKAYFGDQHVHTDCGGTSDGHFPMADWPAEMDRLGLDFAAVVDHRQMRGFFLPEWDEERFIIGTEPATRIKDIDCRYGKESIYTSIHYNMLFPHKYGLAMVLANFPEFQFQGDELTGSFSYARFTKAEMEKLFDYVTSIGGIMVHPHPKTMLVSDDPLDYYFGEGMHLETLYETYDSHYSFKNYDLWVELLALGKRVYTAAGSDTHRNPTNAVVSVFYTKEKSGRAFFDQMKTGDYAVGAFGMQMAIDNTPMGGQAAYKPGQTLMLRLADTFAPAIQEDTAYELRVYTDQGLAYAAMFNGKLPQALALEVQDRKFYRAEVFDLTHGYRIGVGNPIWLV